MAIWFVLAVGIAVLGAGARDEHVASAETFVCQWDASCPEIFVAGDPPATLGGGPAPFRGYGDPSLEVDPATGTIWMAYSWLDVMVDSPGPPPVVTFGVRTHLARSDDGGATFTYVRALNATEPISHPDTGDPGWTIHEVPTITQRAPGDWEAMWLTYFNPQGQPASNATDHYYTRSLASAPAGLGNSVQPWASGWWTSPSFGVAHDLSQEIPELSDCAALTEPALFTYGGETYLATNCVVVVGGQRQPQLERLVLLREEADGYSYVGNLLDYNDAVANGGERFEQADLSVAQNGAILLIATPTRDASPNHAGCRVFEVTDLAQAKVRRDASGAATALMSITGDDDNVIGPGLCTHDASTSSGVLMVMHSVSLSPFDINFSLRATGLHPQGPDSDVDDVADVIDNCPSWVNPTQELPSWPVPTGDTDCDGFPDGVAASGKAPETYIGTDAAKHCAATTTANDEPTPDANPADFNDDRVINGQDTGKFGGPFGSFNRLVSAGPFGPPGQELPGARFNFNGDTVINGQDTGKFSAYYNKTCG